jgi:hydroxymethylglutaryl-CoA lyase
MLEAMGLHTGVDLDGLIASREILLKALPGEVIYGNVPEAGLPKGFSYASERRKT